MVFCLNYVQAQSKIAEQKDFANSRIEISNLEGKWLCENGSEIEFVKENDYQLIILPQVHIGPYTFVIDSNNTIAPRGYAPNWPPYYCSVTYTGRANIDILYWHLGFKGMTLSYQKGDKPKN